MEKFNKIETVENGVVMSIQLPFVNNHSSDDANNYVSGYSGDFLREYRGLLLDALRLRIESCFKHLNENILNVTFNNGSIIGYCDRDNINHIFNIHSYNSMVEWYERLKTIEDHRQIPINIVSQLIKGVGIISGSIYKYDYEIVMTMLTEKLVK